MNINQYKTGIAAYSDIIIAKLPLDSVMAQIIVHGGQKLCGTVKIEGGKNIALPILAASLLADKGQTILTNVPALTDVTVMCKIFRSLNVKITFNEDKNEATVDATELWSSEVKDLAKEIRASILLMGPLLARCGYVKLDLPGGCAIGNRPLNLHFEGLKAMGADVKLKDGYLEVFAEKLTGNTIWLGYPSVGATHNLMMAAVKACGVTVIENAAKEPEIVEFADFLNKMGARIRGAGSDIIYIEGVKELHGTRFLINQDRHEAATFMIAAAMTQGDVLVEHAIPEDNHQLITKLIEMGAEVREEKNGLRVIGPDCIKPTSVTTKPHPGYHSDIQAPMTAMMAVANGSSTMTETIYENRFQHLKEMVKMGANVVVDGNTARIDGGRLRGAQVRASDLRAAAALVLAGLTADGVTCVSGLQYLDRGYCRFHEKLANLGAKIERI